MKLQRLLPFALSACCAMLAGTAYSQSPSTYLYIVHAASGRQLSSSMNPELPVDVLVNDQVCIAKGAKFGDVLGPFAGNTGVYDFKVSLANTTDPCTNPAVYEVPNVSLVAGQTNFGVIALSSTNQLTSYLFSADLTSVPMGQTHVVVANVSDESLTAAISSSMMSNSLDYIAPGASATAIAPSGMYTGSIFPAGKTTAVSAPFQVTLQPRDLDFYFLGGSAKNGSVQVLHTTIRSVF